MKIRDLLNESEIDDLDRDEEPEVEPDQETIKPLMVQLRSVYNLVKKYRDFQKNPEVKEILATHPIIFRNSEAVVIPIGEMADMLNIYPMLIPHMREKMQAQAWENPEAFHKTVAQLKAAVANRR
jgi:hypothetical protein